MKKIVKLIRIVLVAAVLFAWYQVYTALFEAHYASFPAMYDTKLNLLPVYVPLVLFLLLLPFPVAGICIRSGYRLHRMQWLFLEITKPDKLRVRLTKKFGYSARLLPPRTDGTSPYLCYLLSGYLCFAALGLLTALLAVLCWRTPAARYLNILCPACLLVVIAWPLLPTRRNPFDTALSFRKSRDLRRAWECNLHTLAALDDKVKLSKMPEEWFLPYPDELKDEPLVMYGNFNRAAWLCNQERYAEAYEGLRYFFDLKPEPRTHHLIAMAILNGVVCEALGEDENGKPLPPMCMSQLDHPSLKLPLPPEWEAQRLQAEYARALFLHHDEAEATAILPKLEAALDKAGRDHEGIEKLQRKAGLLAEDAAADKGEQA